MLRINLILAENTLLRHYKHYMVNASLILTKEARCSEGNI